MTLTSVILEGEDKPNLNVNVICILYILKFFMKIRLVNGYWFQIMDGEVITLMRTAAASAVALKVL